MALVRQCPLQVLDVLEGCRQIIGIGYRREAYMPLLEEILNRFFFLPESDPFESICLRKFGCDLEKALEAKSFIEREILPRIQRSFGIIYPSKRYDYIWEPELQCILIREFETRELERPLTPEPSHAPTNDISDDWIPERLRR